MGRHGPAPTPTSLKLLRGNPGHRPLNKLEPKPAATRPKRSKVVTRDPAAKRQYDDLIRLTENMKVLTEADGRPLEKIAYLEARFSEMAELVEKTGFLVANKNTGMVHINPLLKEMKEIVAHLWRGYREFGFTPAARASLRTPEGEPTGVTGETDWSGF